MVRFHELDERDPVCSAIAGKRRTDRLLQRLSRRAGAGNLRRQPQRLTASRARPFSLKTMAQTTVEARQQLLDSVAEATDQIGFALACLAAAYEQLDVDHAEKLEEQLFRPIQRAYGRAKRTHADFAGRHGLAQREFRLRGAGLPSIGAKAFIENAVVAVGKADAVLADLQDSLLPVEVGDPETRAGLAELRGLVGDLARRAREVLRTLGR
jgi:hypothetical protein